MIKEWDKTISAWEKVGSVPSLDEKLDLARAVSDYPSEAIMQAKGLLERIDSLRDPGPEEPVENHRWYGLSVAKIKGYPASEVIAEAKALKLKDGNGKFYKAEKTAAPAIHEFLKGSPDAN